MNCANRFRSVLLSLLALTSIPSVEWKAHATVTVDSFHRETQAIDELSYIIKARTSNGFKNIVGEYGESITEEFSSVNMALLKVSDGNVDMVRKLRKHNDVEFVEEGTESQNRKYLRYYLRYYSNEDYLSCYQDSY